MNFIKHPFLTWTIVSVLVYTGIFWAYYSGLLGIVFSSDFTNLAASVFIAFNFVNLFIGYLAWRQPKLPVGYTDIPASVIAHHHKFEIIQYCSSVATSIGFVGTIIGLASMFEQSASMFTTTDPTQMLKIMQSIGKTSGTALYPTLVGLVVMLILKFQLFLLEYAFLASGHRVDNKQ